VLEHDIDRLAGPVWLLHFGAALLPLCLANEDKRRWLTDRRHSYAVYLRLAESMLEEISDLANFITDDGKTREPEDETLIKEGLHEYFTKWQDELQPALGDVLLLATSEVADLTHRTSDALMEISGRVEARQSFNVFLPDWYRTRDLIGAARNAMRAELGELAPLPPFPVPEDWPWLPDSPEKTSATRVQNNQDLIRQYAVRYTILQMSTVA
jgi:hypothetical protein